MRGYAFGTKQICFQTFFQFINCKISNSKCVIEETIQMRPNKNGCILSTFSFFIFHSNINVYQAQGHETIIEKA